MSLRLIAAFDSSNQILRVLVAVLVAVAFAANADISDEQKSAEDPSSEDSIVSVSILALIATPERYDGRRVFVQGYRRRGSDRLYLGREDADFLIRQNSLMLEFEDSTVSAPSLHNCYLAVEGIFRATRSSLSAPVLPRIESISRVRPSIVRDGAEVKNICQE